MKLLQNVTDNFQYLTQDFIGISFSLFGVLVFFYNAFIAIAVITIIYFLGDFTRKKFFSEYKTYNFFINIVIGYIILGTSICLLGVFSLLQPLYITILLAVFSLIAVYGLVKNIRLKHITKWRKNVSRISVTSFFVLLFILISFLRLITPEITEDAYHTDLPSFYLQTQTMMHESRDSLHVIPYPQLAEMIYLIPIFLDQKEAARFIYFGFYILTLLLLFRISKEYKFAKYAPLIFASTPLVIRYSSTQYVDFFMVLAFLTACITLNKPTKNKNIILSGILLSASFATKIWTLVYLPAFLLYIYYLNKKLPLRDIIKKATLFGITAIAAASIWYGRAFILTGNPLYPIFAKFEFLEQEAAQSSLSYYFTFNSGMFSSGNLVVLSPLFFLSVIFFILSFGKTIKLLKSAPIFIFFLILSVEQLFTRIDLGRYLFAWYSTAIIFASVGTHMLWHNKMIRYSIYSFSTILVLYYLINTLFVLPYGLGWADKNSYLTRVLGRDNASYYDFDHRFNKHITKNDLVGTYGIVAYYYADFNYIDINFILSRENRNFDSLKQHGVTKLFIKGGDMEWFCKTLSLKGCDKSKYSFISTWPDDVKKYNLYEIK